MSALTVPTFAYQHFLTTAADDAELVPMNVDISWLIIDAVTTGTYPVQVGKTIQVRIGAGPWLVITTPFIVTNLRIKEPGCPPHSGGVFLRAAASTGVKIIAQGGP